VVAERRDEAVGGAHVPAQRLERLENLGLDEGPAVVGAEVAGADAKVDLEPGDRFENGGRQARGGVEMRVRQMQDPVALERRWQVRQLELQGPQAHIQAVGEAAAPEASELQAELEGGERRPRRPTRTPQPVGRAPAPLPLERAPALLPGRK
jgi:hypothetical protein